MPMKGCRKGIYPAICVCHARNVVIIHHMQDHDRQMEGLSGLSRPVPRSDCCPGKQMECGIWRKVW